MKIKLEFFGPVRDRIGDYPATLTLDACPQTLDALVATLAGRLENGDVLLDPHLRIAINDQLVTRQQTLTLGEGAHIAVLSPFSGG